MSKNYGMSKSKKDQIKWAVAFTLIALLIAGFIGLTIVLNREVKTVDLTSISYEIGSISDGGLNVDDTAAIRTKDFVSADGFKVEVVKNPKVTYRLYFYDATKTFISATQASSADYDGSAIPDTAKYVKVMISPVNDAEVTLTEIVSYSGQLIVTVNR